MEPGGLQLARITKSSTAIQILKMSSEKKQNAICNAIIHQNVHTMAKTSFELCKNLHKVKFR